MQRHETTNKTAFMRQVHEHLHIVTRLSRQRVLALCMEYSILYIMTYKLSRTYDYIDIFVERYRHSVCALFCNFGQHRMILF